MEHHRPQERPQEDRIVRQESQDLSSENKIKGYEYLASTFVTAPENQRLINTLVSTGIAREIQSGRDVEDKLSIAEEYLTNNPHHKSALKDAHEFERPHFLVAIAEKLVSH